MAVEVVIQKMAKLGVLTGGPCAGKTTVTSAITGEWDDKLTVAPEVATVLLEHLYPKPGGDFKLWIHNLQTAIYPVQLSCERAQLSLAEHKGHRLVLCDRGSLDGAAYVPGGMSEFVGICGIRDPQAELARYDFVIHLESVATVDQGLWDALKATNPARYETYEQAVEREMALREIYKGHPNYHFIPGAKGIDHVVEDVQRILSAMLDTEVERKWLLDSVPPMLSLMRLECVDVQQGYITDARSKTELRLRRMGSKYYMTVKGGEGLARTEWERSIPRHVFEELWPQTEGRRIEKMRYFIPHGAYRIELDVFSGNNAGLTMFEIEFSSVEEAARVVLPEWAANAEDVTEVKDYKNKALAS